MKALYTQQLQELDARSREIRVLHCLAVQRSILQVAAIGLLEYLLLYDPDSVDSGLAAQLLHPADGTPLSILDSLLPAARSAGWPSCAIGWYEAGSDAAWGTATSPLVRELTTWVRFRNERFAHGVVDDPTWSRADDWLPNLARQSLNVLEELLPIVQSSGRSLSLQTPRGTLPLQSIRLIDNAPPVLSRIKRHGSVWRFSYQRLHVDSAAEESFDLSDSSLLRCIEQGTPLYVARDISLEDSTRWTPLVSVPARQTSVFYGRHNELRQLQEWYADTESRACLVYGEGGIGKTTLALEFVNSLLESHGENVAWRPEIIAFYSAKQTRWGSGGLEYLRGIAPMIAEAVRLIAKVVDERLGREWYDEDPRKTIDRAAGLLKDHGFSRESVLLVLDNTETLSRSQSLESDLGDVIRHLSKRLCRVLITSRRRERVEAAPIQVLPMSDEEGATLLTRLSDVYGSDSLQRAGNASLRKYSRKLSGRPLLLDVFARHASGRGSSLDSALHAVLQTAGADLGRFLFDDAWQRIGTLERDVFAVVAKLPDPIDSQTVGWICAEVGIAHELWLEAFEETRFGQLQNYGARYDLEFLADARSFVTMQYNQMNADDTKRIDNCFEKVRRRTDQYLKAQEGAVDDRIREAFRTSAAKAAKIAAMAGRLDDAKVWYDDAIRVDPSNSALWDRYAWFALMRLKDLEEAERLAKEACRLDEDNADAFFTLGMIEARRGSIRLADQALKSAENKGKGRHLVALQRAKARIVAIQTRDDIVPDRLLIEAKSLLEESERYGPTYEDYADKHLHECRTTRLRLGEIDRRLRESKRTIVEYRGAKP